MLKSMMFRHHSQDQQTQFCIQVKILQKGEQGSFELHFKHSAHNTIKNILIPPIAAGDGGQVDTPQQLHMSLNLFIINTLLKWPLSTCC